MSEIGEKLSTYLDGELTAEESARVEKLLEIDPEARAEMEMLIAANSSACDAFDEMLNEPAPLALYRALDEAPKAEDDKPARPATVSRLPGWAAMAAAAVLAVLAGTGGYMAGRSTSPAGMQVASAGWLQDIAEYHVVYASQKRHLVEVGADEADHLQTWLSNTVGASFQIPDLTAQLIYTDASGKVIALCIIQSDKPATDAFKQDVINGVTMVEWRDGGAAYVIVGEEEAQKLKDVATAAATQV
ncbi:anti-sigma factor family protein [Halovulum sp. GXIMD14793]